MSNQINWEKSFFLSAEEVATLGLEGISVNDMVVPESGGEPDSQ